ncbi:MAG: DNA-protecting protein DprA [Clostridia bacterium]|nr:DNA-protecting protein DprA [Clostridia bacterium]
MNDDEMALLWLDYFDFVTYKKKEKLLEMVNFEKDLLSYNFLSLNKDRLKEFFSAEEIDILIKHSGKEFATKIEKDYLSMGILILTKISQNYPQNLLDIDTPPFVIYYKGDEKLLKSDCFGIVGTRHISSYGKAVTEKFTRGLADAGFTIVSGLASGVDTLAHSTTLMCKGKTIAVLAGGIDEIYPVSNTRLAEEIVKNGGLIISEVRPKKRPDSFMFPIRNRIISALSKGVLVTEAQEKSGVIHTKNYALDYGKDMFAVPGSIFNLTSVGANRMIVNGQAKAVLDVEDILCEYNITKKKKEESYNLSIEESLVIELLKGGEKTFQEIVESLNMEVKKVNTLLTMLSIRGIIKKLAGNIYYLI